MTAPVRDLALIEAIACRLRWHIRRSGHSVHSFAGYSGLPPSTLDSYVRGQRRISVHAVEQLARAGVDTAWLLTGRRHNGGQDACGPIHRAVAAVLDDPVDYSDQELEFAITSAWRLSRYGTGTLFTSSQLDLVARINSRAAELARH